MESRIGSLEGAYLQVADRLNSIDQNLVAFEEQVDKRFEDVDRRLEGVERRFVGLEARIDKRLEHRFGTDQAAGIDKKGFL